MVGGPHGRAAVASILVLFALCAAGADARAHAESMLLVWNRLEEPVTVFVDGAFRCRTAAGGLCRIPLTPGPHRVSAARGDGRIRRKDVTVRGEYRWCLYQLDEAGAAAACQDWLDAAR